MNKTSQIITLLLLFIPVTLTGQPVLTPDAIPVTAWPAPLWWLPPAAPGEMRRPQAKSAQSANTGSAGSAASSQALQIPLQFIAMPPCRLVDTRGFANQPAPFGGPQLAPFEIRSIPITSHPTCIVPTGAAAYSLNFTVVPASSLQFLSAWPDLLPFPGTSVLNAPLGGIVANAAITPSGSNYGIRVMASHATDLIIDINGYFVRTSSGSLAGVPQSGPSTPALSFAGDPGTGIFSSGTGTVGIATGGISRLTVRSDGDFEMPGNIRKGSELFLHDLGLRNLGVGLFALNTNAGSGNTATGYAALSNNTTGINNTATGDSALSSNTTGLNNTAMGAIALYRDTTGTDNTASGAAALSFNTTGSLNTATGSSTLHLNTSGGSNTAAGFQALFNNTLGSQNTADGSLALQANTTGSNNTALGYDTLPNNQTGRYNIAIGANAGQFVTGDNNIDIGNQGSSADSGYIRIGDSSHKQFFVAAVRGVTPGASNAVPVVIDSNGQLGITTSSRRFKEDIENMSDASSGVLRLRPVIFRYSKPYADGSKPLDYGLIAEEVAEVYPDLVVSGPDGRVETVQYQKLIPMLLNEVQKLHSALQEERQHNRQRQETIDSLQGRLAVLEMSLKNAPSSK